MATGPMTLAGTIQATVARADALRAELLSLETELIEAGEILGLTIKNPLLMRRGRTIRGGSVRAQISKLLSDGNDWTAKEIKLHVPHNPDSVAAQLSRMAAEGDIVRIVQGLYRKAETVAEQAS